MKLGKKCLQKILKKDNYFLDTETILLQIQQLYVI